MIQAVNNLDDQFKLGPEITQRITKFFEQQNADKDLMNKEMSYLLKILPPTHKTNLAKFLYKDAISMTRILQDRDDNFYSKYLDQLNVQNFFKDELIAMKGRKEDCVYFIIGGLVRNVTTGRYFESGHMINYDCIYQNVN